MTTEADFKRLRGDAIHYYRLTSGEMFAIPSRYQQFWKEPERYVTAPRPLARVPMQDSIGFQFFTPGFSGYTPENYKDDFHPQRVNVLITVTDPKEFEANPGLYWEPQLVLTRLRTYP